MLECQVLSQLLQVAVHLLGGRGNALDASRRGRRCKVLLDHVGEHSTGQRGYFSFHHMSTSMPRGRNLRIPFRYSSRTSGRCVSTLAGAGAATIRRPSRAGSRAALCAASWVAAPPTSSPPLLGWWQGECPMRRAPATCCVASTVPGSNDIQPFLVDQPIFIGY